MGADKAHLRSAADPLTTSPPRFARGEAEAIARRLFGVSGDVAPLDSERDQNFRLTTRDGRSYLLKISNHADDFGAIEMQTQAMLHIGRHDPGLPVMRPLPTADGSYFGRAEDERGRLHLVRLLTFVPGRMVDSVDLDAGAIRRFGSTVARMGLALRGFFHPAAGYRILWDLKLTPELRPLLDAVREPQHRDTAQRVLDRFDAHVAASLPALRGQIIHNDLTLDNVLLDDGHNVSGIVDFGDLTHTALICDLAIALASLMWGRADSLAAAEIAIGGYRSVVAIEDAEADVLADLLCARLAALALIANWRVRRYPENAAYITANVDLAWALLELMESLGFNEVRSRMRAAATRPHTSRATPVRPPAKQLIERRTRVLGPALAPLSYDRPLYLVRAEGAWMYDVEGNAYLDAYNNVPVVGHSHPAVAEAIAEQSATLNTNTRYLHESVVELGERLVATMPDGLDTVLFLNSGSEANDIAWRLATTYTGGSGAIVTRHAYHGVTTATIALSPEEWTRYYRPGHVATVPAPDGYRGLHRPDDPAWVHRYAHYVDEALEELGRRGITPAVFYVDSMFTSDGILTPPNSYLQDVVRRLRDARCLVVADEVQCGFGRSGSHMWSYERAGITPDFVTLGKPMGNGHPIAAVVTRSDIAQRFAATTDLFSTFGGNPVACRAALAVLDVLRDDALQSHADHVGARLRRSIESLMGRHPAIGDVRGAGLMVGVELVRDRATRTPAPELAHDVMNRMRDRRVLVGTTGPDHNVLKIRPPLVLTADDADLIARSLDASLPA
jgi:4-aminobutyrate aminotransferase-like enzyme/Ser/Thr protein kinase RdoA (MazF antagonist)